MNCPRPSQNNHLIHQTLLFNLASHLTPPPPAGQDRLDSMSVDSDTASVATTPHTVVSTRRQSPTPSLSSETSCNTLSSDPPGRPPRLSRTVSR